MYKNKEEVAQKIQEVHKELNLKAEKAQELQRSALVDRGRIEELKNLYEMFVAVEKEAEVKEE